MRSPSKPERDYVYTICAQPPSPAEKSQPQTVIRLPVGSAPLCCLGPNLLIELGQLRDILLRILFELAVATGAAERADRPFYARETPLRATLGDCVGLDRATVRFSCSIVPRKPIAETTKPQLGKLKTTLCSRAQSVASAK